MSIILPPFLGTAQPPVATGFNIDLQLLHATIIARTGDEVGVIAFGTDTNDLYVYTGSFWNVIENN
jgi:hypothetical protein